MQQNIRFVDLNTGNTFDGSDPYVFWIDGEQSTNIIYSKPICFISNLASVNISIEKNDIFKLIDVDKLNVQSIENMHDFEYFNLSKITCDETKSVGTSYNNYYVHIIYIVAKSQYAGECTANFYIGGKDYTVGADFYEENEELYVNLSNNGVELPKIIQKALYNINVHEENYDNITINRKWKELLSNAWDVLTNKGSYKSLFNSLKWFEYGDNIRLCEIWKNTHNNMYLIKDIQQIFDEKYSNYLNGFIKTTYLSLYYALEKPKINHNGHVDLDEEKNPLLQQTVSKWSVQDLALKLCMLGNFYESYFMPIHLDLIHSTIEDVVYTNTFKTICGTLFDRNDYVYSNKDIICNVNNNDIYRLSIVSGHVDSNTLFGLNYNDFKRFGSIVGIQKTPTASIHNNDEWKTFVSQYFNEVGAIVDFSIQIPLEENDKIKRETLIFKTFSKNDNGEWVRTVKTITNYKILNGTINFSLFCPIEGEYDVKLQFDSLSCNTFTKHVRFNVIDTNNVSLNIYKVQNRQILDLSNISVEYDKLIKERHKINDYTTNRRAIDGEEDYDLKQYIPSNSKYIYANNFSWKGVALNHMMIILGEINPSDKIILDRYYFLLGRTNIQGKIKYTICISKTFGFKPSVDVGMNNIYENIKRNKLLYKEDYIFVPEFHELVPLEGEDIIDYTVTDEDTLCVIPNISYGKNISDFDWEFINVSKPTSEPIKLKYIKEPFIANIDKRPLESGYYDIKFNYRLTNEDKINSIVLNSAFKKV